MIDTELAVSHTDATKIQREFLAVDCSVISRDQSKCDYLLFRAD